ncbi:MAG TPA: hypothetical protein VMT68_12635 [Caulobacteraceae bacterium]|nr:hypothetical protein [Caulobacteraceae bacterium]
MWVLVARPLMIGLGLVGALVAALTTTVITENPIGTGILAAQVIAMMLLQLVGSLILIVVGVAGPVRRLLGAHED